MSTGVRMPSTRNSPHVSSHPAVRERRPIARAASPEERGAPGGERERRDAEVHVQVSRHRGQPVGRCRARRHQGLPPPSRRRFAPARSDRSRGSARSRRPTAIDDRGDRGEQHGRRRRSKRGPAAPPEEDRDDARGDRPDRERARVRQERRREDAARPATAARCSSARQPRPSARARPPRATARTHWSGCRPP